jgi:hypothetical protein
MLPGMSGEAWVELVFMMVILKLPIVYLILVVWWAIRAVPEPPPPLEGAALPVPHAWSPRAGERAPGVRRPRPRGGPVRTYARRAASQGARARR